MKKKRIVFFNVPKTVEDSLVAFFHLSHTYKPIIEKNISGIKKHQSNIIVCSGDMKKKLRYIPKGKYIIYLSSNEVFSGRAVGYTVADKPDAKTERGKMLIENENLIKKRKKHLIVRLSTIFDASIFKELIDGVKGEKALDNNKTYYILPPFSLTSVFETLIDLDTVGIVHIRGNQPVTKFKMATILSNIFKMDITNKLKSNFSIGTQATPKLYGLVLPVSIRVMLEKTIEITKQFV